MNEQEVSSPAKIDRTLTKNLTPSEVEIEHLKTTLISCNEKIRVRKCKIGLMVYRLLMIYIRMFLITKIC